jgi:MoaA/NifB/PqqE/SkfB family radical SAM enzyme
MSGKQLQFELWQECNSKCKFCYLGKDNNFTPDELKLSAMNKALEKISDMSLYPEFDTLAYLGGEFFQGQMKNTEVKAKFMELMEKTVYLLNNEYIKHVWIYATLTIGNQEDLYETLKLFEGHKGELWILTSYDTMGRFHTPKMEENWDYHMRHIHELYPDIKFNITTILSEDCIDKYLSGELSFKKMIEKYHTTFFFKQCGASNETKAAMNERLPHFFPPRSKFINFLKKFRMEESDEMWNKLFNIQYRADNLYRNFNDPSKQMTLSIRHKNSINEVETNCEFEMRTNTCGHLLSYAAYSDCDGCVVCDKEMIEELYK